MFLLRSVSLTTILLVSFGHRVSREPTSILDASSGSNHCYASPRLERWMVAPRHASCIMRSPVIGSLAHSDVDVDLDVAPHRRPIFLPSNTPAPRFDTVEIGHWTTYLTLAQLEDSSPQKILLPSRPPQACHPALLHSSTVTPTFRFAPFVPKLFCSPYRPLSPLSPLSLFLSLSPKNPAIVASRCPLILLRRLMWLLGCWAEQIPASLRPALVQATANVMKVSHAILV